MAGVTNLQLGENGLRYISPEAFSPHKNWTDLDLRYNKLTYEILTNALSVTSLKVLDLGGMGLGPLPGDLFHRFPLPHLELLQLFNNNILSASMYVFVPLGRLEHLSLDSNNINTIDVDRLARLTYLNLANNSIEYWLETCDNTESLFPSLKELRIRSARISYIPSMTCLPGLEILDLSANQIRVFPSDMFTKEHFPNLRSV